MQQLYQYEDNLDLERCVTNSLDDGLGEHPLAYDDGVGKRV
jgi:hypothetical protein